MAAVRVHYHTTNPMALSRHNPETKSGPFIQFLQVQVDQVIMAPYTPTARGSPCCPAAQCQVRQPHSPAVSP